MLTGERPEGSTRLADVASPELEAIVRRAMAPQASERFGSAGELAQALSAFSSGGASSGRRRWRGAAAMLALVLSVALAWSFWPRGPAPEGSIVVLPFANMTPDAGNEYMSDGLTEEIITGLAAVPDLKVISRTSAMYYKGSKAPIREIANVLKVAHVLEGSVRQNGEQLRITVQLIDARTDVHLWTETYDLPLRDLFAVQARIARQVVRALQVEPGEHGNRTLARRGTRDTVAYDLYRRGRYFWAQRTREGHRKAVEYFEQAIVRDSNYAAPYSGLADAYLTDFQNDLSPEREPEVYRRMKWAAERALALDDQSAEAHASFAALLQWQYNWPGAEREYRRALELNPGDASARSWYALLLLTMGRLDEARRESMRAFELDPFSIIMSVTAAQACYVARDYDCAIEFQTKSLELNDRWVTAYGFRGVAYSQLGNHDAALRDLAKAVELAPRWSFALANMAYVLARSGRASEAREYLRRAKMEPQGTFYIGRAHVALGEADSAFVWLERSQWRWAHRAVRADPALDPVRSDPRFAQLMARVDREMGLR
jgi:serine/threonine-protein kinase